MAGRLKYAGIVAKVKAMNADLLKKEDYDSIIAMQNSNEVIEYLRKKRGYRALFEGFDAGKDRLKIEQKLERAIYEQLKKIYIFSDGSIKRTMEGFFQQYEIELLKNGFRDLTDTGKIDFSVDSVDDFFKRHISFDLQAYSEVTDRHQLLDLLKDTPYYLRLKDFVDGEINIFEIEMHMENYYYSDQWKLKDKEKGSNKEVLTGIIGSQIDMLNIIYIYRARNFYKIPKDLTYTYLIPINHRISKKEIINMVEVEDEESFRAEVAKTKYTQIFALKDNKTIEMNYKEGLLRLHRELEGKYPLSIAPIWAYLYRKTVEIENLISIIENIAYGLASEGMMESIATI